MCVYVYAFVGIEGVCLPLHTHVEARGQCWVFSYIPLHLVF